MGGRAEPQRVVLLVKNDWLVFIFEPELLIPCVLCECLGGGPELWYKWHKCETERKHINYESVAGFCACSASACVHVFSLALSCSNQQRYSYMLLSKR